MREVAFVRSPVAHARLTAVRIPDHLRDSVFTAERPRRCAGDPGGVPLPGFQASEQPPLAIGKIRHVGELIADVRRRTRAEAEDIAAQVVVEYEELPAVVDMLEAAGAGQRRWCTTPSRRNVYLEVGFDGPIEAARQDRAGEGHARAPHRAPGACRRSSAAASSRSGTTGSAS